MNNVNVITVNKPLDKIVRETVNECLYFMPRKTLKFLKTNGLVISVIEPGPKAKEHLAEGHSYAYSDYNNYNIYLSKTNIKNNIIQNLYHELGHFTFLYLCGISFRNPEIKRKIEEFQTIPENGCTLFADKYMREVFGKKLREDKKHMILNIDIKYHEQFAELFRTYMQCHFSKEKWKLPTPLYMQWFIDVYKTF